MSEKEFLKAAIDEYFHTGNELYKSGGKAVMVNFDTITRYKSLPDPVPYSDFEATAICPE